MKEQGGQGIRSRVIGCKIMCVVCNRYFSAENNAQELSEHQEREHFEFWKEKIEFLREKFKDRTCTICDKRFNTPGDYRGGFLERSRKWRTIAEEWPEMA